jgi:uncharacterized membrane protein
MIYRLAARLLRRDAGFIAAAMFVCLEPVIFAAGDARPYGLLLLVVTGSTAALVSWLDHPSVASFACYILLASLLMYTHYLAGTTYLVHAAYTLMRAGKKETSVRTREFVGAAICIFLLLLPLIPFVRDAYQKRYAYSYAGVPDLRDFVLPFVPPLPVIVLLAGFFLALLLPTLSARVRRVASSTDLLILSWAILPVAMLFLIGKLTVAEVFLPRYALPAAPGLALVLARVFGMLEPQSYRLGLTAAMLLLTAFTTGSPLHITRSHSGENWRDAIRTVNSVVSADTPVVVYSQYTEASRLGLWRGAGKDSNMFSPLSFYSMRGRFLPFSLSHDRPIADDAAAILPELEKVDRFVLVQPRPVYEQSYISSPVPWQQGFHTWLEGRLSTAGFHLREVSDTISPAVLVFERAPKRP